MPQGTTLVVLKAKTVNILSCSVDHWIEKLPLTVQGEGEDPAKPVGQRKRHPGPPDVQILILVKTVDSPETLPETQPELM